MSGVYFIIDKELLSVSLYVYRSETTIHISIKLITVLNNSMNQHTLYPFCSV